MPQRRTASEPRARPRGPSRGAGSLTPPAVTGWGLAGAIGITLAVALAVRHPFPHLPPALAALLAIMAGWSAMLLFAPWRAVRREAARGRAIAHLTRTVDRLKDEPAAARGRSLIPERDEEIGALSRAVHEALTGALVDRRKNRLLQRTMDDAVRRETNRATARLRREASTDPLTGLANRRAMEQRLEELFGPDRRRRRGMVVAMVIDVDLFKTINDSLGHDVGDRCLVFLSDLLASTLRREDCAVRLGGDEFAVLMPNLAVAEARAAAERIAALFGQMPWPHPEVPRPTLSIGLAHAPCDEPDGAGALLRRADAAVYRSKSAGRNCIRGEAIARGAA